MRRLTHARQSLDRRTPPSRSPGVAEANLPVRSPAAGRGLAPTQARAGSLEAQAEHAADRLVRGDRGVGRLLGRTAAATLPARTTRGEPLAAGVRAALEEGFGADLAAVRVHRDAGAAALAQLQGARAFAAGPDVVFAAGTYRPASEDGLRLLVHEVAHVLQQTGRVGADGRLRATSARGSGPLQHSDPPETPEAALRRLRRLHGAGASPEAVRFMDAVSARLGGRIERGRGTVASAALEEETRVGAFAGERREGRAFLHDALKLIGHHAAAAALLEADSRILTAQHVPEFTLFLLAPGSGFGITWGAPLLEDHPSSTRFWPGGFEWVVRRFLYDPHRPVQVVPNLREAYYALGADGTRRETLSENERVLLAFHLLVEMETILTVELGRITWRLRGMGRARSRRAAAVQLRRWADGFDSRQHAAEVSEAARTISQLVRRMAREAQDFWEGVQERQAQVVAALRAAHDPADAELPDPFPAHPQLDAWAAEVQSHGETILSLSGGAPPTPGGYVARRNAFKTALANHGRALGNALYLESAQEEPDTDVAEALAEALLWNDTLVENLDLYDHAADLRDARRYSIADHRLAHRIRMGRALRFLALRAPWSGLAARGERVATHADLPESRLLLMGAWTKESGTPIEALQDDFASGDPLLVGTPLTSRHIVLFFGEARLRLLQDRLETLLEREERNLDPRRRDPLSEATTWVDRLERPERWSVDPFEYAFVPGDSTTPYELLHGHPKTQEILSRHLRGHEWRAFALPKHQTDRVFVWLIPSIEPLVAGFRQIPALRELVEELGLDPDALDPHEWLEALASGAETLRRAMALLQTSLVERYNVQTARQPALNRRLAILRRRRLARAVAPQLDAYGRGRIENWSRPNDVLARLQRFTTGVQPAEDAAAQSALLILELAPALRGAFVREGWFGRASDRRYDLITGYYGLIRAARDAAAGPEALQAVLHEDESLNALLAGAGDLDVILAEFDETRRQVQRRFGFRSRDGRTLESLVYRAAIEPGGDPFTIDGVEYRLVEVEKAFAYHPAYGAGTGAQLDAVLETPEGQTIPREGEALFQIEIGGSLKTITDDDPELDNLSYVVEMRAFQLTMESLAAIIEGAALLALDLATLIPGIGQALTVAQLVATVGHFVTQELPALREELLDDPEARIREMLDRISQVIEPARFAEHLLFGASGAFDRLAARRGGAPARRPMPRRGRLGRLLQAAGRVERKLVDALVKAQRRIQPPVLRARSQILVRPGVAFALEALADVYRRLDSLSDAERSALFQVLTTSPGELEEAVVTLVEGFEELELPGEVLPIHVILDTLVYTILDRFGGRGRAIRMVLERLNAMHHVTEPLAAGLAGTSADPNQLWRSRVLPRIQDDFVSARDGLVDQIYTLLGRATAGQEGAASLRRPALPEVRQVEEPFPEAELYAPVAPDELPLSLPRPDPAAGQPLPPPLRSRAEARFGHDFSHVRLHTGADAARLTGTVGADGLASGSHVYLRPPLSPTSGHGREVLHHELAHVLQQTGSRPLGYRHDSTPRTGRAGAGVRIDPNREAAAERMAAGAGAPGGLVEVSGEGEEGWLPSMSSLAARALFQLSSSDASAGAILQAVRSSAVASAEVRQRADAVWSAVIAALGAPNGGGVHVRWPGFMSHVAERREVRGALHEYLEGRTGATVRNQTVRNQLGRVARLALERPRGRPSTGAGAASTPQTLDYRHFGVILAGFTYARTGISLGIGLDRTGRLTRLTVRTVDLGRVPVGERLWSIARSGTRHPGVPVPVPADWKEIRQHLRLLGPDPQLWDRDRFRLSRAYLNRFFRQRSERSAVQVPLWTEYTNPDSPNRATVPGLRVGTHGALKGLDSAVRNERESHHVPQFLLAEYFYGDAGGLDLFGWDGSTHLPGFDPTNAKNPSSFASGGGNIGIASLLTGERGDAFPAVLLAADTHRRGKLHVNAELSWDKRNESRGARRQGFTVDREFRRQLRRELRATGETVEAIRTLCAADENAARTAVHRAMKATYAWMYEDLMKPALERSLETREVAYYAGIAARDQADAHGNLPREYDPDSNRGALRRVMAAVERENNSIMREWR